MKHLNEFFTLIFLLTFLILPSGSALTQAKRLNLMALGLSQFLDSGWSGSLFFAVRWGHADAPAPAFAPCGCHKTHKTHKKRHIRPCSRHK